ncbi:MAG: ABC transporter ATP-binding protein [Alphaproteobacteria bacterium]|nr:ABC transporter ATP-binding protein [Alphaproteobacteria bacterium]
MRDSLTRGGPELLRIEGLHTRYGESQVLHGLDLVINRGEVVSLLGRNGAGKTTTLKSIMGILRQRIGSIWFDGKQIIDMLPEEIARLGIGYCPEERGIFASLTVEENLMLPPAVQSGGLDLDEIFALFPNIQERRGAGGSKLSGGEQQMLAIARILRTGASLLLLDEPMEGLAPVIVQQIARVLHQLKERGFTVLLIEQNLNFATDLSDWHYVIENGRIVDNLSNSEAKKNSATLRRHLGM